MTDSTKQAWRSSVVAVLALVIMSAWGCGRRAVVQDGSSARQQRELLAYGERHTGCPAGQLQTVMIGQSPAVWSVMGCTQPREYWLNCARRRCRWERVHTLNEIAARTMQCPPQMIQQQLTQSPNLRVATGCGQQMTYGMQCNGRDCDWAPTGAAAPVAASSGGGTPVTPTAQPQPSASGGSLTGQLQAQREAILTCTDRDTIELTLRWTADGMVQVQLPPDLAGSAAEGCIQAALANLRVQAEQAGSVTIPVQ